LFSPPTVIKRRDGAAQPDADSSSETRFFMSVIDTYAAAACIVRAD